MRAGQKLVLGFGVTLIGIVGTWTSASLCITDRGHELMSAWRFEC